jgi:hypothetical protein
MLSLLLYNIATAAMARLCWALSGRTELGPELNGLAFLGKAIFWDNPHERNRTKKYIDTI